MGNDGFYGVLWPGGERRIGNSAIASRPSTLGGKRVALLWDYLFKGDEVFTHLQTYIRERFPDVEFIHWDEFGNTHGPNERAVVAALPQRLREMRIDVAISGMGC